MSDNISNLSDTIIPKSDQLNSDQLLGGAITILITAIKRGSGEDQPVWVHYEGDDGRPYKPCKSMRKVLIAAWGDDGHEWIGRAIWSSSDLDTAGCEWYSLAGMPSMISCVSFIKILLWLTLATVAWVLVLSHQSIVCQQIFFLFVSLMRHVFWCWWYIIGVGVISTGDFHEPSG